jgi:hypothetical protein
MWLMVALFLLTSCIDGLLRKLRTLYSLTLSFVYGAAASTRRASLSEIHYQSIFERKNRPAPS